MGCRANPSYKQVFIDSLDGDPADRHILCGLQSTWGMPLKYRPNLGCNQTARGKGGDRVYPHRKSFLRNGSFKLQVVPVVL